MKYFMTFILMLSLFGSYSFATSISQISTLSSSITTSATGSSVSSQIIDNSLVTEFEKQSESDLISQLNDAKKSLKLNSAVSCENFNTILTERIKKHKDQFTNYYPYRPSISNRTDNLVLESDVKTSNKIASDSPSMSPQKNEQIDFSSTNVQKIGIDEPDIIKNDGNYVYYIDNTKKLLYIIKGPYANLNIDISSANVIKILKLPKSFNATDLLISANTLVLVSTRYVESNFDNRSFFDRSTKTDVYILNITNKSQPKIVRLFDFPGQFQDARLVNGKVYVVSNLYFNRGPIYYAIQDKKSVDSLSTINNTIPTGVEAIIKSDGKIDKYISRPGCSNLQYILPEKLEDFSPNIGIVHTIDLKTDVATQTNLFYGNAGQIHMTDKSLYTVSTISLNNYNYNNCPSNAKCLMPLIWRTPDEFSLIHKYDLTKGKPMYQNSAVIKGSLLNQYSMDESTNGEFRILTKTRSPELSTHLWKFDNNLNLQSQLLNIEPGEEFKSSRFIGDKLYLVTFQQIDPLFVIDLASKPRILGELKIPGYSQYLHPYSSMKDNKQLLIGLGVDTVEKDWRTTTNGVKLDLYEVNYTATNNDNISIKQLYTKTFGGKNSYTEAIDNPRVFVWNEKTKQLLLPVITQNEVEKKVCNKDYYGQEYCYPNYSYDTTFAGLKKLSIDPLSGITELGSKDYKTQIINYLKSSNQYSDNGWDSSNRLDQWQYMNLGNRVGYFGEVSFFINNAFIDFNSNKEGKLITF